MKLDIRSVDYFHIIQFTLEDPLDYLNIWKLIC